MQETWVQSLGQEVPLEKENGNPLQYSCLGNPMGRGTWWAIVYGRKELDMTESLNINNYIWTFLVGKLVKNLPAMWETRVQSLGREDLLEKENGNPLQYSCLENPMDGGTW